MKRNLRRLLALVLALMLALPAFALADESEAVVEPQAEPEIVLDEGILGGEDVEIDPEFEGEVTTYGGELVADGVQADAEPQTPKAPAENSENPGQNDDEDIAEDNAGEIAESNNKKGVASINQEERQYDTLNEAYEAAKDGDTIKLRDYCTIEQKVEILTAITIDLNSYSITVGENASFIVRNGKITNNGTENTGSVSAHSGGTVNISGGTIDGSVQVIANDGGGVSISGGTISDSVKVIAHSGGTVNISGGTIDGSVQVIANEGGEVIISEGTINGTVIADYGGEVTISGGTVNGEVNVKSSSGSTLGGTLNISGGTVANINVQNDGKATISEGAMVTGQATVYTGGTLTISGGTVDTASALGGTVNISGGNVGKLGFSNVNGGTANLSGGTVGSVSDSGGKGTIHKKDGYSGYLVYQGKHSPEDTTTCEITRDGNIVTVTPSCTAGENYILYDIKVTKKEDEEAVGSLLGGQVVAKAGTKGSYTFDMPECDVVVTVEYKQATGLKNLTISQSEGTVTLTYAAGKTIGTVEVRQEGCVFKVWAEETVNYKVEAAEGYGLVNLMIYKENDINNPEESIYSEGSFEMPNENVTISPTIYKLNEYSSFHDIKTSGIEGKGNIEFISPNPGAAKACRFQKVKFRITGKNGYKLQPDSVTGRYIINYTTEGEYTETQYTVELRIEDGYYVFEMPLVDVTISASFTGGYSGPSYSLLYDRDEETKQEILAYEYAEEGVEPNVTVMYGGTAVEKAEYTVSYENNTALGTGKVTVKSKEGAPHTFTLSREFTIVPAKIVPTIEEDELGNIVVKSGEKIIPEDQYNLEQSVDAQAGSRTVTLTKKEGANYTFEDTTQTLALTQVALVPLLTTVNQKTTLWMEWPQQYGAAGYEVYFGKGTKTQRLVADVTGLASHEILGLKKGTLYSGYVKAYILVNGEKVYLKNALTGTEEGVKVSAYAGGTSKGTPKIGNVTRVKVKSALTLQKGKTKKLKAKLKRVKMSRKPIAKPKKLRYYSTDKAVATVSSKGKVKAVGAGVAVIYVISGNGAFQTVTVTVTE